MGVLEATPELKGAALKYIRELRSELLSKIDILQYVEDPKIRDAIRTKLD